MSTRQELDRIAGYVEWLEESRERYKSRAADSATRHRNTADRAEQRGHRLERKVKKHERRAALAALKTRRAGDKARALEPELLKKDEDLRRLLMAVQATMHTQTVQRPPVTKKAMADAWERMDAMVNGLVEQQKKENE